MSNKQDSSAEKNQAAAPIPTTEREKTIVRTSILGIVANVLLAAFKAVVGVVSNSIAITLDAVNNLSDALSSVITIVGTKLAGRAPDKRHPMGYGRIEYLTAMVISIIVLYAGITSAVESVQKIVSPEAPDYSAAALVVVAAGVVAKVLLGRHVQSVGRRVNADSLVASGWTRSRTQYSRCQRWAPPWSTWRGASRLRPGWVPLSRRSSLRPASRCSGRRSARYWASA